MRVKTTLILLIASHLVHGLSLEKRSTFGSQLSKHHGSSALEHIDEAEILQYHDADTLSYYQYDFEGVVLPIPADNSTMTNPEDAPHTRRHGGLMIFHAFSMVINYLMVLPILIVLNAHRHRLRWLCRLAFWALNLLGWSAARAYRRTTPNLYVGSTHGSMGNILVLLSAFVSIIDIAPRWDIIRHKLQNPPLLRRLSMPKRLTSISLNLPFWRSKNSTGTDYLPVSHSAEFLGQGDLTSKPLGTWGHVLTLEPEQMDLLPNIPSSSSSGEHSPSHTMAYSTAYLGQAVEEFHGHRPRHSKAFSLNSDNVTLHDDHHPSILPKPTKTLSSRLSALFSLMVAILSHSLVLYGWEQVMSGFTIYVGFGRAQYINGILAHFIKGSIFFWFGVMTFARYLGAWARLGWAWNRRIPSISSSSSIVFSATFVESLVIFLYGFTQQFMERFGKHAGDPYTAKDIEHISIAVMFWGAGLVGMAVESPTIRGWIMDGGARENVEVESEEGEGEISNRVHPPTPLKSDAYHVKAPLPRSNSSSSTGRRSFLPSARQGGMASNPLPAFVIGITGIAMSAHHQTYAFQVQIHALWGYLLLGFAVCRCLTCFLEWVRPARPLPGTFSSMYTLPSHPPSELIGSIFLGAGGIAFICSDEQITFWAMRTHKDDVMMFLNLAIAFTCVAYVWTTIVLTISGRMARSKRIAMEL
ncbi:hypothetical protein FRC17_002761 [Serendipita sp. 399]|nr:hypothetical protein FRC17_002761 [Serendipita sp. 399]